MQRVLGGVKMFRYREISHFLSENFKSAPQDTPDFSATDHQYFIFFRFS